VVLRLRKARRAGTLERLQQDLQRADLLVLDEWGMFPWTGTAPGWLCP